MSRLRKFRRLVLREAKAIVAEAGGSCDLRKPNGCGHHKLVIQIGGECRVTPISGTPTRDIGHHTGGWWKNPDYERCWHLSMAQRDPMTGSPVPKQAAFYQELAEAFFGGDAKLTWLEGPYTPEGKALDVWHYRLFCDEGWQPIKPRGEVYSKEFTEAGWHSFSDIHGAKVEAVE